jgi:hypothetical protein
MKKKFEIYAIEPKEVVHPGNESSDYKEFNETILELVFLDSFDSLEDAEKEIQGFLVYDKLTILTTYKK